MDQRENIEIVYQKIKDFLILLKQSNIPVQKAPRQASGLALIINEAKASLEALLYGSFARGNAHKDSDIDLALISEKWEPDFFDAQYQLMKIARKIDSRIEPRPIDRAETEDPDPFIQEILRTGKPVTI